MTLQELIDKYHHNHADYVNHRYNETQVRSEFLDPLFELLGWDIKNTGGKSTNEREVVLEESLRDGAETTSKKPDYTFRLFSERRFFLEAKKPSVSVEENAEFAKQVRRYGFTARLKISVLSNFEYLLIYDCSVPVGEHDNHHKALIKQYHYTEYLAKFEEIQSLLGKDSVYSGLFDEQWKDIEEQLKLFSVDHLFLEQINNWRLDLGTEILKHDSEISDTQLNDVVQSYLNRIIFLRVCEDRNLEQYRTLLSFATNDDFQALIRKFEEADRRYNSGLFEQRLSDEIVKNISSVFWVIIRQLYFPESPYSFSVFASDVLGNIYEIFLSEKLARRDGSLVLEKKAENVDKDIITTPVFIIKDILRQTLLPATTGKNDGDILALKVADIACGSGAFLLEVFQFLNDSLVDYYLHHDPGKLIHITLNTFKLPFDTKRDLLLQCIRGADKDYNAVEATKFGLLLKLLEDENTTTVEHQSPILPPLEHNITWGNSLITPAQAQGLPEDVITEINPFDFETERYDIIVGNPPYMKAEDMKNITKHELPLYKANFKSAHKQFDKYFLFIERSIELLKDGGRLGYIVPSKFAKVGAGSKLRHLLSSNGYIERIISFGANQIFDSKTTYTCLFVARKTPHETLEYLEVKNLKQWKVRIENEDSLETIQIPQLDDDVWILVPHSLQEAYASIAAQSIALEDLVGDAEYISNGIQTSANDIYVVQPTEENDKYFYFEKDGDKWKIERELTRPYFQTSAGIDNLHTYRLFKPNSVVIYPYRKTDGHVEFVIIRELKKKYPHLSAYLHHYKDKLADPRRDIKPEPETRNEWYRYGRHQALDKCDVPEKIIVGVLSQGNKYAIDRFRTLISSGGTAGYCMVVLPGDSPYSIYYLQAILNSKYVEWFSTLIGEVFRGGYVARGTKVLKRLPIRKIDFANEAESSLHDDIVASQKRLITIYGKVDRHANNPRLKTIAERDFHREQQTMDRLLTNLYNLGMEDNKIPLIKEVYAAD